METAQVYGFEMIHTDEIDKVVQRERALLVDLRDEESYRRKLDRFLEEYGSFDRGTASADVAEQLIKWLNVPGENRRGKGM